MENTITASFGKLNDPRRKHKKLYSLVEIVFLTITAMEKLLDNLMIHLKINQQFI